jgi:ubiquinone/menaquinone biosynthesis C-methylase UbiE
MNPAEFANIARAEKEFWWYRGMREILFHLLDPIASVRRLERVLEAGCGTGHLSRLLAERFGWTIFPLDLSAQGLKYARDLGVTRLTLGDILSLPFADAVFDALLSLDVIVHLERGREHQALAEFARVLKPGGLLLIRASALDLLRSRHSQFALERQRFTRARLVAAVESAGFHVERITYLNSLLLPVALLKFRVWEPLTNAVPQSGVQPVAKWLDRLLYLSLRFEAGWIGRGGAFPAGQSLVLVGRRDQN